jgi:para-nitrobenzyl esterase
MIGTNRDELNLFTMATLRDLDKPMEDSAALAVLQRSVPTASIEQLGALLAIYRGSRERRDLPSSTRALLGAIQTDRTFRMPSIRFAEAYAARNPDVFMYLFTYESPAMRGALRACHALEIPFVFGTLSAPFQDRFAGKGPQVERLSELMMDAWIAFARTGRPSHPALGDFSVYERSRRATMVFDKECMLQDAPSEEERSGWQGFG